MRLFAWDSPLTRHYGYSMPIIIVLLSSLKLCGVAILHRVSEKLSLTLDVHVSSVFYSDANRPVKTVIENTVHFGVDGDDAEWEAMIPNKGIVYLGDANMKKPFTISMFHQLRCLNIIRQGVVDLESRRAKDPSDPKTSLTDLTHHCVNYLRQMVLCRSDLDLDAVFGRPKPAVYPDTYQCKDWEAVYRDIERNQEAYFSKH